MVKANKEQQRVNGPAEKESVAKELTTTQAKTTKTPSQARGERRQENAIVRYFRQTRAELRKTSWPSRREATRLTAIVLVVTAAMSAMLGVVDWLFSMLFSFLIKASAG